VYSGKVLEEGADEAFVLTTEEEEEQRTREFPV